MSKRLTRPQKAITLVPLAILSAATTASLVGVGGSTALASSRLALPDGTAIPAEAIEVPASVTMPGADATAVRPGTAQQIVATASTNGIPSAALDAYQRAATVINAADSACAVPWQLIAAIGRVESDHGRANNNTLDADGVSRPGIYGIALDGSHGTAVINDTDAGQYDQDAVYDRAVGPMQFIPSTWSVVGVDADGDSLRNPQDINDAALATAVYLCSGPGALDTLGGQQSAIYRYNHSQSYVDLVLGVMNAYLAGDYTAVPNSTTSASWFPSATVAPTRHHGTRHHSTTTQPGSTSTGSTGTTTTAAPTTPAAPSTPTKSNPVKQATEDPVGTVTGAVQDPVGTVTTTLTYVQAVAQCTLSAGPDNILSSTDPFDVCMQGLGY